MLLNAPHEDTERDARAQRVVHPGAMRLGAVLAVVLVAQLAWALSNINGPTSFPSAPVVSVATIGRRLFTDYAFPFEVTSVLILVAMVGAVVMARHDLVSGGKR
jgi:NADH:ubiquinone oxidoreductase subunit 6 (subunit J)